MNDARQSIFALAIYPFSRGFAYVLFESASAPVDWAVKEIKEKHRNGKTVEAIHALIERYQPDALIIEDSLDREARRSSRIRKLYRMIVRMAAAGAISVFRYSRADIRKALGGAEMQTRDEMAKAVAGQLPAFRHRVPRVRKAWMGEDPRTSLFSAAALGIAFFALGDAGAKLGRL